MYLTAQRVASPRQIWGINAFYYEHGPIIWPPNALLMLDQGPGTLVEIAAEIEPLGGNRVLSFLDIVAPDGTPRQQIWRALELAVAVAPNNPHIFSVHSVAIRAQMDSARAAFWHSEFLALSLRAVDLCA